MNTNKKLWSILDILLIIANSIILATGTSSTPALNIVALVACMAALILNIWIN